MGKAQTRVRKVGKVYKIVFEVAHINDFASPLSDLIKAIETDASLLGWRIIAKRLGNKEKSDGNQR